MGASIDYSDIPPGFQLQDSSPIQQSFNDIPPGFSIQNQTQEHPSALEDAAKSFGGGIEKGAVGLPMVLPNMINQLAAGPQLLGRGIAENVDKAIGIDSQPRGDLWKPFYDSQDVTNQLPDSLQPHEPQTTAGVLPDVFGQLLGNVASGKTIQSVVPKIGELAGDQSTSATSKIGIPSGTTGVDPNAPLDIPISKLKELGTQFYQSADAKGGTLNQPTWDQTVDNAISQGGAQTVKGKIMMGKNNFLTDAQETLFQTKGSPTSLAELGEIDDNLRARSNAAFRAGETQQSQSIMDMRDALKTASRTAGQTNMINPNGFADWQTGDKIWTAYRSAQDMQDIIDNAEKADVPSTAIKNGFKSFVKNTNNKAGLTDEEWDAANKAATTGLVTGALKTVGNKLISGVAGGGAGLLGGGLGGALVGEAAGQAVGYPLRTAATAIQRGKAETARDMFSQRPDIQAAARSAQGLPAAQSSVPMPSLSAPVAASMGASQPIASQNPSTGMQNNKPVNPIENPQSSLPDVQSFVKAESGGNPNAKNPNSSASGLYQFTNKTWNDMVARYGKQTGINLGDKNNPQAQATMASLYAKDNIPVLQKSLGRMPNIGELYAAHVLGPTGASRLFAANPNSEAIMSFPRQVFDANHNLFFNGKIPRTVGEVRNLLTQKVQA